MAPVCHFLRRKPEALRIMELSLEMHSSGGVESTGKFAAKQTTSTRPHRFFTCNREFKGVLIGEALTLNYKSGCNVTSRFAFYFASFN